MNVLTVMADVAPILPPEPVGQWTPSLFQIAIAAFFIMSSLEACVFIGLRHAPRMKLLGLLAVSVLVITGAVAVHFWAEGRRTSHAANLETHVQEVERLKRESRAARRRNQQLRYEHEMKDREIPPE